jgi:hypothetical protein
MRNERGKWRLYLPFVLCIVIAVAFVGCVFIVEAIEIRWAAFAVAIAFGSVALSTQGLITARYTDNKLGELNQTLIRLETLQNEIKAEQEKQKSTNTPVIASMTALSQLVEFFGKKKADEG